MYRDERLAGDWQALAARLDTGGPGVSRFWKVCTRQAMFWTSRRRRRRPTGRMR
jgi:hypothetical protein